MNKYTLDGLSKIKHLSEYKLPEIFTKLGLYQEVIIDTYDTNGESEEADFLSGGDDIKMFNALVFETGTFMLPCTNCGKEQTFKSKKNSIKYRRENSVDEYTVDTKIVIEYRKPNIINTVYKDKKSFLEIFLKGWKSEVLSYNQFSRQYKCLCNSSHKVYGEFIIEDILLDLDGAPVEVLEYKKELEKKGSSITDAEVEQLTNEYYKKIKGVQGYVILKKIGQYPSIADMQFFEIEKYKTILNKKNKFDVKYRDYTKALGLYANGIGCGAFLYLRRVFEMAVEELHEKCKKNENWDEQAYSKASFNNKVKMIEYCGNIIFPPELEKVRSKIYGVLSKGIHESSEEECKDIFPDVKTAIDMILEKILEEIERNKKINSLSKRI